MRVVEFFAGCGGASLGIHEALAPLSGVQTLAVEWDADAVASHREILPDVPAWHGDVNDVPGWTAALGTVFGAPPQGDRPWVDLFWASPPCQPFSQAGKQKGAQDERNQWPATLRAIDVMQPRWFIMENVRGLLSHAGKRSKRGRCGKRFGGGPTPETCSGCYFEVEIVEALRTRFAWVDHRVLDAADYGVPQHRRRVFVIAGPREVEWPEATHGKVERGGVVRWRSMGEALGITNAVKGGGATGVCQPRDPREPAPSITGKGTAYEVTREYVVRHERGAGMVERHGERVSSVEDPSPTIAAGSRGSGPRLQVETREYVEAGDRLRRPGEDVVSETWREDPKHPTMRLDRPAGTLRAGGSGHSAPPAWREVHPSEIRIVGAGRNHSTKRSFRDITDEPPSRAGTEPERALWLATGRRRLTTTECGILQDFPLDAIERLQGTKTSLYKQIGNAVPRTLARVLVQAILAVRD